MDKSWLSPNSAMVILLSVAVVSGIYLTNILLAITLKTAVSNGEQACSELSSLIKHLLEGHPEAAV